MWIFFEPDGVLARDARLVIRHILEKIEKPSTEIFPKEDRIDGPNHFGNFINCPLFGGLVLHDRTVFIDAEKFEQFPDQWQQVRTIRRVRSSEIQTILRQENLGSPVTREPSVQQSARNATHGLTPCAQRMLAEGVPENQRVVCYRLACQLRMIGFPFELAVSTLIAWSHRNRPRDGKSIIRPSEIRGQTRCAYNGQYRSYGCEDPAITPFCDPSCPVLQTALPRQAKLEGKPLYSPA